MARVTVTNLQSSQYLVPSPIRAYVGAGQTATFDGISISDMEKSDALVQAINDGTILLTVAEDPGVLDAIEGGNQVTASFGTVLTPMRTQEWIDPAAADADAIVTSVASAATEQVYSGAALDGVIGGGLMSPPRNVVVTTTVNADIDAVAVVVTGLDIDGNALTDTITLTDGGNAAGDAGTACFAYVTSITIPAQSGPGGAVEIGFGDAIGLASPIKARAGAAMVFLEVEAGSVVTTGTFALPAAAEPNGSYTPATVPDASNDYALTYEVAL